LTAKKMEVGDYLRALKKTGNEKPQETREALRVYIRLWESLLKEGVVRRDDEVEQALRKIDSSGGLYRASER
jgi:hypothetical protein